MNIKTRLFLYNILIILISFCSILFIYSYMSFKTNDVFYSTDSITIDENIEDVKLILMADISYQSMVINLERYHYDLYIYQGTNLIYGENNPSLTTIVGKQQFRRSGIRTLFIDNATTIMKKEGEFTYFAMQNKSFKEDYLFQDVYTPYQGLFLRFILLLFFSIIIILVVDIFLSNRILKRVMRPLNLLKDGAERVQNGNYNEKIKYENNDEFSSVIYNFNEMQLSLKEKTEKTKNYESARKEMINGISHDIRTPLTVVKGNIKGIQDGVASTKEKRDKYLKIAYKRVLDIENLLNRLFDTFKYETNELKLNKEKTNLKEFLNDIILNNENVLNKKIKVEFSHELEDDIILIDKIQFQRVFDNLLNNTVKHNKDKKNLKVSIHTWKDKGNIKISFRDNGKGIMKKNTKLIFQEFFKEDPSRNDDKSSSGLGLFIVKQIIESHGGKIEAFNRDGLYFEITLKKEG